MKSDTYLFDFDGTLVDSMPYWSNTMLSILKEFNVKYPDDILDIICPLGYHGTAKYYVEILGLNKDIDYLMDLMQSYCLTHYQNTIPLKDGVYDYLINMKKQNKSLNILTASPHSALDSCLKRLKVYDLFDNVWSCDDFKTTKTNPKIYEMVAEKLNRKCQEIVFFDDNINSIKTAKGANMQTVGVFDISGKGFNEQLKKTADHYIDSFVCCPEF